MENPLLNTDQAIEVLSDIRRHLPAFGDVDTGLFIGTAFDSSHSEIDRKRFITGLKHIADKKIEANNNNKTFILCIDPNFPIDNIDRTISRELENIRVTNSRQITWEEIGEVIPNAVPNVLNVPEPAPAPVPAPEPLPNVPLSYNEEVAQARAVVERERAIVRYLERRLREPNAIMMDHENLVAARRRLDDKIRELEVLQSRVWWGGADPEASGEESSSHEESSSSAYNGIPNSTVQHVNNEEGNQNSNSRPNNNRRNLIVAPPVENTIDILPLYLLTTTVRKEGYPAKIMYFYVYFMRYAMETSIELRPEDSGIAIQRGRQYFTSYVERCSYSEDTPVNRFYQGLENLYSLRNITSIYINYTFHANANYITPYEGRTFIYGKRRRHTNGHNYVNTRDSPEPVDNRYLQNLCELHTLMWNLKVERRKTVFFINIMPGLPVFKRRNGNPSTVHDVEINEDTEFYRNTERDETTGARFWEFDIYGRRITINGKEMPMLIRGGKRKTGKRKGNKRRKTRKSKK